MGVEVHSLVVSRLFCYGKVIMAASWGRAVKCRMNGCAGLGRALPVDRSSAARRMACYRTYPVTDRQAVGLHGAWWVIVAELAWPEVS